MGAQFARLADAAAREGQSHVGYLEALLGAEMEQRESRAITRLLQEALLPRMKKRDAVDFDRSGVAAGQMRTSAEGADIARSEPILLVGEAGTGKMNLATGLCVAACRQRRRVRFATAAALVNELSEASHASQLSRALGRRERLDLICIDELGLCAYVPLAETAYELMFQVIADRAERAAVIVTTNLPFSEWSPIILNPRLCKALIDRLRDGAHIITAGTDSYRFHRTTVQRTAAKPAAVTVQRNGARLVRACPDQPGNKRRVNQDSPAQECQSSRAQPGRYLHPNLPIEAAGARATAGRRSVWRGGRSSSQRSRERSMLPGNPPPHAICSLKGGSYRRTGTLASSKGRDFQVFGPNRATSSPVETKSPIRLAVLVGIQTPDIDDASHEARLEELGRLVKALVHPAPTS